MKRRTIGTCVAGSIVGLSGCLSTLQPDTDEEVEGDIDEEEETGGDVDSDDEEVEDADSDSDIDSDQDHPTPVTDVSDFESYTHEQLSDADAIGYDGSVEDLTGQSSVEIEMGVNDISHGFDPVAIRVSQGTVVRWNWSENPPQFNLVLFEQADSIFELQSEPIDESGYEVELQLDEPGVYIYASQPQMSFGMVGSVIVSE